MGLKLTWKLREKRLLIKRKLFIFFLSLFFRLWRALSYCLILNLEIALVDISLNMYSGIRKKVSTVMSIRMSDTAESEYGVIKEGIQIFTGL